MKGLKGNGNNEQRQRISDELRQLKALSKGLRTKSLKALMERHAAKRLALAKPALPAQVAPAIAATRAAA